MKNKGTKWTGQHLIQKHLEGKIQMPDMVSVEKPVKKSKYSNVKVVVDGIPFDSKKEAERYGELKLLEINGEISCLTLQPVYELKINDVLICKYKADFYYYLLKPTTVYIIEDVKGMKTPVYRLKKKLMKAIYNIDIKET